MCSQGRAMEGRLICLRLNFNHPNAWSDNTWLRKDVDPHTNIISARVKISLSVYGNIPQWPAETQGININITQTAHQTHHVVCQHCLVQCPCSHTKKIPTKNTAHSLMPETGCTVTAPICSRKTRVFSLQHDFDMRVTQFFNKIVTPAHSYYQLLKTRKTHRNIDKTTSTTPRLRSHHNFPTYRKYICA